MSTSGIRTLKIDGKECGASEDQTILEVARENGIYIPTLCNIEGLGSVGACRLCLVEIKGSPKLQAACVARVQEGMEVTVNSERLKNYRKMILELLFSERNHICSVCVTNNHCDLQATAQKLEVTHITVPYRHPKMPVDASHPRFVADHNRCILCTRCVRVCGELEGAHTWDVFGRGVNARVITDLNGQEVLTCQINQRKTQINIATLPAGVYFVRLTNVEATLTVARNSVARPVVLVVTPSK